MALPAFSNQSLIDCLTAEMNDITALGDLRMHLYTNDYTPVPGIVLGDLTEAAFTGYAFANLTWVPPVIVLVDGIAIALFAPVIFSNASGSPQDVYGWFITNPTTGQLTVAGRFAAAPVTIPDLMALPLSPQLSKSFTAE